MHEVFPTVRLRVEPQPHTLETDSTHGLPGNVVKGKRLYYRGINKIKMHLLTVLKFGKSPTAELLSTGKDINGLMSSEGCIIRVGVRTRAGRVVVWHALPAENKTKPIQSLTHIISLPGTQGQCKAAELWPANTRVTEASTWQILSRRALHGLIHMQNTSLCVSQGLLRVRWHTVPRFHQQVWHNANVLVSNPPGIIENPQIHKLLVNQGGTSQDVLYYWDPAASFMQIRDNYCFFLWGRKTWTLAVIGYSYDSISCLKNDHKIFLTLGKRGGLDVGWLENTGR